MAFLYHLRHINIPNVESIICSKQIVSEHILQCLTLVINPASLIDGGLYYCTPVDPIFIFLPAFEAARMSVCSIDEINKLQYTVPVQHKPYYFGSSHFTVLQNGKDPGKFRQLDEILYVEGYPGYQLLMSIAGHHMELVCEVKGRCLNFKSFICYISC